MMACSAARSTSVTKSFAAFCATRSKSMSRLARLMILPASRAARTATLSMGCMVSWAPATTMAREIRGMTKNEWNAIILSVRRSRCLRGRIRTRSSSSWAPAIRAMWVPPRGRSRTWVSAHCGWWRRAMPVCWCSRKPWLSPAARRTCCALRRPAMTCPRRSRTAVRWSRSLPAFATSVRPCTRPTGCRSWRSAQRSRPARWPSFSAANVSG
ncbi:hypothetical protein GALL_506360 [mine drainage metagenome]|uniref:Uncharacterized protein n=1 Tax=mine drainage metagenome TaxID=410659 RepID=A0A1J5P952_9ZZZZ